MSEKNGISKGTRRKKGRVAYAVFCVMMSAILATWGVVPTSAIAIEDTYQQGSDGASQEQQNEATTQDGAAYDDQSASETDAQNANDGVIDDASGEGASTIDNATDESSPSQQEGIDEQTENAGQSTNNTQSTGENAGTSTSDQTAEKQTKTIKKEIKTAAGKRFVVELEYGEDAAIPEGSELSVTEFNQVPDDSKWQEDPAYKDRPLDTERFISKESMDERAEALAKGLNVGADDYVYYTRFLNISIINNGVAIQPQAKVNVKIITDELTPAESDGIEAAMYSKRDETTGKMIYETVPVKNESTKKDGAKVVLTTDRMGEFGIAGKAVPLVRWMQGDDEVMILGAWSMEAWTEPLYIDVPEDLGELQSEFAAITTIKPELLEQRATGFDYEPALWVEAKSPAAVEEGAEADGTETAEEMEGASEDVLVGYLVKDGVLSGKLFTASESPVPGEILSGDGVALVLEKGEAKSDEAKDDESQKEDGDESADDSSEKAAKDEDAAEKELKNSKQKKSISMQTQEESDTHNVRVSITAEDYDAESDTVQYTVTVEAVGNQDFDGNEYTVGIADLTTGDSPDLQFVSGKYTYSQANVPEGALATQMNGADVVTGTPTEFNQFPLTIDHMYAGDIITLTYTAKPLHFAYDRDNQKATIQNTVTITSKDGDDNPNPSNIPDDDTASVTTTTDISYSPLKREYKTLDGSWAYWQVTVNPNAYVLNGGNSLTLADTFNDGYTLDANQSIDYGSIAIEVGGQPDATGIVTYDYSGNTGTYVIPDKTPVTITYRTRITAQPGEQVLFRGTAVLKDGATIATSTAGVTQDPVVVYPSASDVTGTDYMVKLYVYGENAMQKGIEGATFILLDANQRALEYKVGENKGQPVTFTTGSDGYVNIELNEEAGDVSIEKNTGYYLEMIQAVDGYQKDNTLYSFMITDDPSYSSGGFYKYYNGDTMKVRLYPKSPGLSVSIRFSGSYSLTEDQQNNVTAVLQKLDGGDNWVDVERHPYTDTQWGAITFNTKLYDSTGQYQNVYRVVEENQHPWDLPDSIIVDTTYYSLLNEGSANPEKEPQEFVVASADDSVNVVIDNRYEEPQLTLIKMDKQTGETLPGAVFSVYEIENGEEKGTAVIDFTTLEDGEVVIRGGEPYQSETLYGIKETQAPEHYLLPQKDEWHYFYFCNDEYLEPSILANLPEGATAINLTETGDVVTVDNQKEQVTIPVMKIWQGNQWPENAEVEVGLYQSVEGSGVVEPVLNDDDTPKTVTLNKGMPYNNDAFKNLPSRTEDNKNIKYSIKEESINGQNPLEAGYNQEYGISSAGVYIVRNKPATTLRVDKKWSDGDGNEASGDGQSPVTFDVYRTTVPFNRDIDPENMTNSEMTGFVSNLEKVRDKVKFGENGVWTKTINDLDLQDDLGNHYYYYVLEYIPSFGNETYDVNKAKGTVTINNIIAPDRVNLTVTKAALVDDPRPESLDRDFEYTLNLKKDDDHPIRSWQVYTDNKHPENNLVTDENGEVSFKLKPTNPNQQPTPGASITLSLPEGVTATVTEKADSEYTVGTTSTVAGTTADDGRTFSYVTTGEAVDLTYTNTLHVICKVIQDDGVQLPFESLKSALARIRSNPSDFTSPWTIYLLEDYTIPVTDVVEVGANESLTITTSPTNDPLFPFEPKSGGETDRATITRGGDGGSMLKNAGTLTLGNICLDGNKGNYTASEDGGLVKSTGTLKLNDKTTLRNSATSGKGGALYAEGTVDIVSGVAITGNRAPSASAFYLNGTLNMTGGSIRDNSGAADGALVVESTSDAVNLSGNPVIYDNTGTQDSKAANLYIGVDSDNAVNVVTPGLTSEAKIGISAMEGHMMIGEQFASAEFEQTANLNRFINDEYRYRGKLKDGTSTNIVWDGLKIKIKKENEGDGANPNDRFTITLASTSIVMSSYIIDGTLDYTVTAARQGRPGTIVLKNVKADDEISISPLPVGTYTITEDAPNYSQTYTIQETDSSETPTPISDEGFYAENDSTVTVTNRRKLADVDLTKALEDRLESGAVNFGFTVQLTEEDGTAVSGFPLKTDGEGTPVPGFITDNAGKVSFTMSPTDAIDAIENFQAPVGATMTITETVDPNYEITVSAVTMPEEGEGTDIPDLDTDNDNVYEFQVTENGANVTFKNKRKMAEIELSKVLNGKVLEEELFTLTLTLTNGGNPVSNYVAYKDEEHPEKSITTDENGQAVLTFIFGQVKEDPEDDTSPEKNKLTIKQDETEIQTFIYEKDDTDPKSITLTIPDGTKLVVAETEVKKVVDGSEKAIYNTSYSKNGGTATTGLTATIDSVSEDDHSIVFTNTRKTNKITVTNTVNGYSGNVVPFTYTATLTDGDGNQDDYDENGFADGEMTFELATGQSQVLTVPYGETLNIAESFIVGYETAMKHGRDSAKDNCLSDEFVVKEDLSSSLPILFTNNQLIGLQLVNDTSSNLENITVTVGDNKKIYLVNEERNGQDPVGIKTTTLDLIKPHTTAILEIQHDTSTTAEQPYKVEGNTPADNYYYTINNEPSFHEYADPAVKHIYNVQNFGPINGKLRYSVNDSIVTFTEDPLVTFDSNGGEWTTSMEGYNDRDGDRKVYQKAVKKDEKVARPTDPIYPTSERFELLGWTTDEAFAKQSHTAGEDISAKAYDFNTPVEEPVLLYAVWSKPARDNRVVTVSNKLTKNLDGVTATLTQNGSPVAGYSVGGGMTTDGDGRVTFDLQAGGFINLELPDAVKLEVGAGEEILAVSSEFELVASVDNKAFTVNSVDRDGTAAIIPGVCKITDVDGNVLYRSNGKPAVCESLAEAFNVYTFTLYKDASCTDTETPAAVKMLVDEYAIENSHTFPRNNDMTLTTAGKDDPQFPFIGMQDQTTLYRKNFTSDSLFKTPDTISTNLKNITITNIILDGRGVKVDAGVNGGLIKFDKSNLTLNIGSGTTMRNVGFAAYNNTNASRGGAIYINNGTLNVSAGVFSNLQARHGGAICAETNAKLSITGSNGSTIFENCSTNSNSDNNLGGDGGAIFYNNANASSTTTDNNLVIDGGNDKSKPGIIFTGCVAGSNWGDGGAIYANTNKNNDVTVTGCSFTECSARNTTGKNDLGFGGGGIGVQDIKHLTVSQCSFTSCDSLKGGGGILARVKNNTEEGSAVSVSDCSFLNCSCKAQGGGLAAYTDNNSATNSKTKLSVTDCHFTNCSSGTDNGSGGAIQCYLPRMEFIGSYFTDCWAGKEGGAVNNYYGSNYTEVWQYSSMNVDDCHFVRCRAEDRYDPTALQHYGGGINTKVKKVTVSNSIFEDCVSTLKEGGALHIGGQGTGSTATIMGSTFKNCSAKNGGGGVLSSHETLTIENCYFYGCGSSASNGGAVYHYKNSRGDSTQKYTTIRNSTFSATPGALGSEACNAAQNGGAIWTRATTEVKLENLTINDCTAGSRGGGVYLDSAVVNATLSGGSISGSNANEGSAVYVGGNATFSDDLTISGNVVTSVSSGAIHGGKLYFEGNVKVENNICSSDSVYDHDVLMQNNNVTTIYTTSNGLGVGAKIGVYVPDSQFNNRGLEGKAFGTYNNANYLESFFNDRNSELYGYQMAEGDTNIYWGSFICKITDAKGNTLTRPNGRDAIYPRLAQALDEFTQVTGGDAVYIKMLVENYAIRQAGQIENFPAKEVTLTTETYTETQPVEGKYDGKHPYRGTEGTVCTISRTSGTMQLFKLNDGAVFQLENITLDGRNDKSTQTGNRRLIEAAAGALTINGGTTLQYGAASNGGAIEAAAAAQVTINGVYDADADEPTVRFINCTGTGNSKPNGGAIRAYNLNITSSTAEAGKYGTAFINCSAYNGGAITALGSSMEINGALFDSCHTQSAGGAIYHNNSGNNTTTTVKNCAFESCFTNGNTWAHGGAIEARTATLNVEDSAFKDCHASSDGGAVYHGFVDGNNKPSGNRDRTSIKNTTFDGCATTGTDNSYNFGGSVYTQAKTVEVVDSIVQNGTSYNHGGAIYCQSSVSNSTATISGTRIENCSVIRGVGNGGAIYSRNLALNLQMNGDKVTSISACTAPSRSGAIYMETSGSILNVTDKTVISGCYADKGGAIYLLANVTMTLTDSPEFSQNGYITQNGRIVDATEGACIYLAEGGTINLSGSPKFSRNIMPNKARVTNGGATDFMRQDIFMAGYASTTPFDTNAASIYVNGELTGDTIWVWPEKSPHILPNEQFAKVAADITVSEDSLSCFRNARPDNETGCSYGEYLAGVQLNEGDKNVYWDKMYAVSFKKVDNKGVTVPEAEFTLYKDLACTQFVAKAESADGETDTGAQGNLLARGTVEFASIRIGAYYMKETKEPTSFKKNDTTYILLVGTPYLSDTAVSHYLWEGDGPLNVPNARTLVPRYTTDAGKYYGVFPLDANNKAILRANLAMNNVGVENIRNDYQAQFMKLDESGNALPGAAFTIYTAKQLNGSGDPETFEDGYPKLTRWSRDGETYPAPVESADGTDKYKDVDNHRLKKGLVYFRELPIGTYYLLETTYPDRNGKGRRTFYQESDRVLRLTIWLDESTKAPDYRVDELKYNDAEQKYTDYEPLPKDDSSGYYTLSNNEVVCKLTDASNNLLYSQGHEVWDKDGSETRLFPAIYPTLEKGFAAAQNGVLVDANDNPVADADRNPALKLQVLKDINFNDPVTYSSSRALTFTTASRSATAADRYVFSTTRTSDTSRALIKRAYNADTSSDSNSGALITVANGASLTLQNVNLNGQKANYNGRAIHVENGSLTILDNAQFQNFKQEAAAGSAGNSDIKGGAILMDNGTSLTINGGFNRTAIFTGNTVANNRTDGACGADGGAIDIGESCTIDITNARFTNNAATAKAEKLGNGGAVNISEAVTASPMKNVVFENNNASYEGGALCAAAGCNLAVENGTFTKNHANTLQSNGGEGGAIAVLSSAGSPSTLSITGGTFTNNTATGSKGGAVMIGDHGTLTLGGHVAMKSNSATDGGAVATAPDANVTVTNGSFANNKAAANGGAFHLAAGASATVADGTFTSNTANVSGGSFHVATGASATVEGGTFTSNTASSSGGAFYVAAGANTTVANGTFSKNKANNGGAFYADGKQEGGAEVSGILTVNGGSIAENTANTNGGAIFVNDFAKSVLSGGTITGNTAKLGSAIYVDNNAGATISNAVVTGNKASGNNGGAINVGGSNARLYFEGTPTVFDNFYNNTAQQRNVVLSLDTNEVINTTENGLAGGLIGVYVTEGSNVYEKHGLPGKPFGTFGDSGRLNPQVFRSDYSLTLFGVRNESNPDDKSIYWVDVICKLTDASDNILYQDIKITINGKEETRKAQAVYARITQPDEGSGAVQDGFNALLNGFDAAQGTLYTRSGNTYSKFNQTSIKLKMLEDVPGLDKTIQYSGTRSVTFTTAESAKSLTNDQIQALKNKDDYFLFRTDRTGSNSDKALIGRAFNGDSMINDAGTGLTLADITLDGKKANSYTSGNGNIVLVQNGSALNVEDGAYLINAKSTGNGGAINAASGATVYLRGGEISGNEAANGGAVYAEPGSTVTVENGVKAGTATRVTISGNTATGNGAGIYLGKNDQGSAAAMNISGNPSFNNNTVVMEGYSSKLNGGAPYTDNKVHVDIYLPEGGTEDSHSPSMITIAGDLTGTNGSIYLWADNQWHYKQLMPFAKKGDSVTFTASNNLAVFRNARDDEATENGTGEYLYGIIDEESPSLISWNGATGYRKVILKKVDQIDHSALNGATFNIYTNNTLPGQLAKDVKLDENGKVVNNAELGNLKSDATGVFYAGYLRDGKYFVEESAVPSGYKPEGGVNYFWMTVSADGVTMQGPFVDRNTAYVKPQ